MRARTTLTKFLPASSGRPPANGGRSQASCLRSRIALVQKRVEHRNRKLRTADLHLHGQLPRFVCAECVHTTAVLRLEGLHQFAAERLGIDVEHFAILPRPASTRAVR